MATLTTDINTYVEKKRAEWIVGDIELVEKEWDAYNEQLKKMGLDELMTIYQSAYDGFLDSMN